MDIRDISDSVGMSLYLFQTFSLTSEVFINIHEALDQKIRLHSYETLSKQPFATSFFTLMLSVAKIQII